MDTMELEVADLLRPSLMIEEVKAKSGEGLELGRRAWGAVTFTAEIEPFGLVGKTFDTLCIRIPSEKWLLHNAKVAFLPGKEKTFVVIYDKAIRI